MKVTDWKYEKDEQLIELVKNNPGLYDFNSPLYRSRCKEDMWNEIGTQLEHRGEECKHRWHTLRCQYNIHLKNQAASNGFVKKMKYANQMNFLSQFMKFKSLVTENNNAEKQKLHKSMKIKIEYNDEKRNKNNEEYIDEVLNKNSSINYPKVSKLIKNNNIAKQTDVKENASTKNEYSVEQNNKEISLQSIDLFFSSIASRVKNFNLADQYYAKTIIFSEIGKIEEKYLPTQNHRSFQLESIQNYSCQPSPTLSQYSIPSTSSSNQSYPEQNYNLKLEKNYNFNPKQNCNFDSEQNYNFNSEQNYNFDPEQNYNFDPEQNYNFDPEQNYNFDRQNNNFDPNQNNDFDPEQNYNFDPDQNNNFNPDQNNNFDPEQNYNFNSDQNNNFNPELNYNFDPAQNLNFDPAQNLNFDPAQNFDFDPVQNFDFDPAQNYNFDLDEELQINPTDQLQPQIYPENKYLSNYI